MFCPKFVLLEKGIPNQLSKASNQISRVPLAEILTPEAAIKHFEEIGGGRLTKEEVYGTDLLEAHPHLKILRRQLYYELLPAIRIFSTL